MTTLENVSDRRGQSRMLVNQQNSLGIAFSLDGLPKNIKAYPLDFCARGLGAVVADPIPMGQAVKVQMGAEASQASQGTVKWVSPVAGEPLKGCKFKVGIQLEEISQDNFNTLLSHYNPGATPAPSADDRRNREGRRATQIDFNRRKFNRREKEFLFEHTVYLSDTNLVGNTYFAKHFEWQGKIREAFLFHIIDSFEDLVKSGVKLITKEAYCEYMSESTVYDTVQMALKVGKVTKARIELLFTFRNKKTGRIISKGRQTIVFGGPHGRPIGIPLPILKGMKPFI